MQTSFLFTYLPLFFPLYLIRLRVAGIPFTALELLIDVAFALALVELLWKRDKLQPARPFRHMLRGPVAPIMLFFIASAISLAMTAGDPVAMGIWKGWVLPSVLFAIGFLWTVRDRSHIDRAMLAYSVSAVCLGVWAVLQVFTNSYVTIDARASGPFLSANYLALYIAPAFLYLVLPGGGLGTLALKRFRTVGAIILFLALFFSASYAAWMSLAVAFLVWALLNPAFSHRGVRMSVVFSILISAVFVGLAAFLLQGDTYKFHDFLALSRRSSSSVRLEVWQVATGLVREHPWWGIGMGQFERAYGNEAPNLLGHLPYETSMLHPHNLFLATWLSTGLLGLVALVWLLLVFFFRTFRKASSSASLRLAIMMLAIVIHGFFDTPLWKNDLMVLLFLIAIVPFIMPLSPVKPRAR